MSRRLASMALSVLVIGSLLLVPAQAAGAATTATVCLYDSVGAGIAGADAFYRAGGYQFMGQTGADGCVSTDSPDAVGRVRFRLTHGGQRQDITQDTVVDPIVVFQTTAVTVSLIDSGAVGIAGADVLYSASGWQTFGTTDATGAVTGELLPANTRFRLTYGGQRQNITQDTRVDPLVVFQTTAVTVSLIDSSGTGIPGADVTYSASGWQTFGTTDATGAVTGELLPANTRFRLYHAGQRQDITQDTGVDPLVVFQTTAVTVSLVDSAGAGIEGADVTYSASGWQTFGTTDATGAVTGELLPANIRFRLSYAGRRQDITQDTASNPVVAYQTGQVLQGTGLRIVSYQASGWIPFTEGAEMLPGSVRFRFEDGSRAYHTIAAGPANYVPTAPTAPVVTATDASADEGEDFVLSASFTDQEAGQTHTATVDWGDGSPLEAATVTQADGTAGTVSATHSYADEAVYNVQVCVTDSGDPDAQGCSSFDLTVANVAPAAAITGIPASATEGEEIALAATVTDPGPLDVISYLWSVTHDGDVAASGSEATLSFTPADDGSYQVSLTVDDGDGGVTTSQIDIAVANVAPAAAITGIPASATEGEEVALAATVSDPGALDSISYSWTVSLEGEVLGSGTEADFMFTPTNDGDYLVSLRVNDGDGGVTTTNLDLTVANVAPSAEITGVPPSVTEGEEVTLAATISDPGTLDVISYVWSATLAGEVVATGNEATFAFSPASDGDYQISLTVDDGDGGVTTSQIDLAVDALPPPAPVEPAQPAPAEPAKPVPAPEPAPEVTNETTVRPVGAEIWDRLAPEQVFTIAVVPVPVPEEPVTPTVPAAPTAEVISDPEPVELRTTTPDVVAEDESASVPAWLLIVAAAVGLTAIGAIGRTLRIRRREAELFAQLEAIAEEPQVTVVLEDQTFVGAGDSAQN